MKHALIQSLKNWVFHDPFTQSAAAAYYAIFSFPGLLIILIGLGAVFFDQRSVEQEVLSYISAVIGLEAARNVDSIISETQLDRHDFLALFVGAVTLLFGATGLFVQLQRSLNHIWQVEVKKYPPLWAFVRDRATALGMVIAIGFVLLISLVITTALTVFSEWLARQLPMTLVWFMLAFNILLSLLTVSLLFALIFKILPDAEVEWRPALAGGLFSSVLFNAGEYLLSLYFNIVEPESTFGAAGSLILLMIWVSYSCMILLLGAEFAKIYGEDHSDHKVKPTAIAKRK